MVKMKFWKWQQWLLALVFVGYIIFTAISPWYYSVTYTQEYYDNINEQKRKESGERPLVEPSMIDQYGNRYNEYGEIINEYGDVLQSDGQWLPDTSMLADEVDLSEDLELVERTTVVQERQLSFREKMIMEKERNQSDSETQNNYKNNGKYSWWDFIYLGALLITVGYGYGIFLSNGFTLTKLLVSDSVILGIKSLYIIYAQNTYKVNVKNVVSWWLGLIIIGLILLLNHTNIKFMNVDVKSVEGE